MGNLSNIGRIFYGIAIAVMGFQTIYDLGFPYMLLPALDFLNPDHIVADISGALLILIGVCIIFNKKTRPVSLTFGCVLLLIFLFLFIPYEFMGSVNYRHLVEWENSEKELALAGGAFVIAGCFPEKNREPVNSFWDNLFTFGTVIFSIPILSFGILHFQYAKEVSPMVPSWIPFHVFWIYFAGVALIGSGTAIMLKIRPGLIAFLLSIMIFTWFIVLHIPRIVSAPSADISGEITSAFIALAYSGIAFVIAGVFKKVV